MNKRFFYALWILCIVGSWAAIPYLHHSGIFPASVSLLKIFFFLTAQNSVLFGLVCWLSYKILPKTDLQPFESKDPLKQVVYPGLIAGMLLGLTLYFFDRTFFQSSLLSGVHPPLWTGLLASLYGGINEEVLLRLFLFTFVYFLFGKVFKFEKQNRTVFLWMTNIIVAIAFGLGHLPAALKLAPLSSFEIFRVLFLNGIAGVVFGWLYWSNSLWAAMAAHFVADLMIHVFLI